MKEQQTQDEKNLRAAIELQNGIKQIKEMGGAAIDNALEKIGAHFKNPKDATTYKDLLNRLIDANVRRDNTLIQSLTTDINNLVSKTEPKTPE